MARNKNLTGIEIRHRQGCATRDPREHDCPCRPTFRATVSDERRRKLIRSRTYKEVDAAINWRAQVVAAVLRGEYHREERTTVAQAGEQVLAGMRAGTLLTRSGTAYKPATIRGCEQSMRDYIGPTLGRERVTDLERRHAQDLVEELIADGRKASTIRNAILPLRLICRRAVDRGEIAVNPMLGLRLPRVGRGRERVASPAEAAALIDAVPEREQPVWATAMYAGLRYGELRALHAESVDLDAGLIDVKYGWDPFAGLQTPKSAAGIRRVPIIGRLRPFLERALAERATGLLFGTEPDVPFQSQTIQDRADRRWRDAGMTRITLHECRHTFASLMIAAGVNAKTLQIYMGHSTIATTLDLYGHLFPGAETEFIGRADRYLDGE
jgi:integrase